MYAQYSSNMILKKCEWQDTQVKNDRKMHTEKK
jgi:hypothetical protein